MSVDLKAKTITAARRLLCDACNDLSAAQANRFEAERILERGLPADKRHRTHLLADRQAAEAEAERTVDAAALILAAALNESVRAAQGLPSHSGSVVRLSTGAADAERARILKARGRNAKP